MKCADLSGNIVETYSHGEFFDIVPNPNHGDPQGGQPENPIPGECMLLFPMACIYVSCVYGVLLTVSAFCLYRKGHQVHPC